MLQIYLYGTTESGFIDLDPDTTLDFESLSDAFDEDLTTGEFSLPIDIPWTENNRRLFGFTERIENFKKKLKSYTIAVYYKMFPELPRAMLTILEKSGNFSYRRGKFSTSITGTKGLFGSQIKNKTLKDLQLGGKITWSGINSREFAEELMKGLHPQYGYVAFAPVAIEQFYDTNRKDYNNEFLARDTVNTVIVTGTGIDDWTFGRPLSTSPTMPAGDSTAEHRDYLTIPFFRLKYVILKVFEETGYKLSGDFIDDHAFDDLFMFNNYGIENYALYNFASPFFSDYNRSIIPSNHVPDILIADFIKGVFQFFNVFPVFSGTNEVRLVYRNSNLKTRRVLSLNGLCNIEFTCAPQNSADESGYKLSYTWDSNDSYNSDRVKDLKDKTLAATVQHSAELATLDIGRQLTTDDIAYVEAENMYYNVADATGSPILWDCYAEGLDEFVSGAGEKSVECNISTLCTYVEQNTLSQLFERRNYVGCRQPGSFINSKNIPVINDFGLRIFYIQKQVVNGVNIPVSFNHNRNANNERIVPYSLAWKADDGIAANLHKEWQDLLANAEIVKTTIRVDQRVLNDLRKHNCYEIDNVLYLPYKTEPTIPLQGSMNIELVPL